MFVGLPLEVREQAGVDNFFDNERTPPYHPIKVTPTQPK